jgi:ankyrin repeat protein
MTLKFKRTPLFKSSFSFKLLVFRLCVGLSMGAASAGCHQGTTGGVSQSSSTPSDALTLTPAFGLPGTALHSSGDGNEGRAKLWISGFQNVNEAVREAAREGYLDALQLLLKNPSVELNNALNDDASGGIRWSSPLNEAVEGGNLAAVELLIEDGRIQLSEAPNTEALASAVAQEDDQIVALLLSRPAVDPNLRNSDGETPLLIAAEKNSAKSAQKLLADSRTNALARTITDAGAPDNGAMHLAARTGSLDVMKVLLADSRFDVNLRNSNGETALMLASLQGSQDLVALLVSDSRSNLLLQNTDGQTAIQYANLGNHPAIVVLLKTAINQRAIQ